MCPSEEDLRRYLNEELDEVEQAKIKAHLENCESCAKALKAMVNTSDGELEDELQGLPPLSASPTSEPSVGTHFGRYKLLEKIGEGGMGEVWIAKQSEPVKRKVALKLIKPGMDSRDVLARFKAEQQALALMDHPNIAKVLDGGLTEAGRNFFVMELVKRGMPITEYCDANRLSVRERLKLFVPVCQAIQHAHQKGVVHRDLKPSNVLVARYDGRPVPKVIDFGLAKALGQPLTELTLHTVHGTILGTPQYMSPEQAQLNNLDVDTRTDVYSLGVLLYELLTGTTPIEGRRLKEAAREEFQRIIREEEPPQPSVRLSSTVTLPLLATNRQTEPARLTELLREDLDWIAMRSLEKDRDRRYQTASELAREIERHLAGEPVEAHAPSILYRLQKFVRKHRLALMTASVFAAMLVVAVLVIIWYAIRADKAADLARAQARIAESRRLAVLSDTELHSHRRAPALLLAVEAIRSENTLEARNSLLKALLAEPKLRPRRSNFPSFLFFSAAARVNFMALSLTGKTFALSYEDLDIYNENELIHDGMRSITVRSEWDYKPSQLTHDDMRSITVRNDWGNNPLLVNGLPRRAAFSPDGRTLALGYIEVNSVGIAGGWLLHHSRHVLRSIGEYSGRVAPWEAAARKRLVIAGNRLLYYLLLVLQSIEGYSDRVALWDVAARKRLVNVALPVNEGHLPRKNFISPKGHMFSMVFSPDGKTLAVGYIKGYKGYSDRVALWDVAARKRLVNVALPVSEGQEVSSMAFSPDGKILAVGTGVHLYPGFGWKGSGGVVLWDVAARKRLVDNPLDLKKVQDTTVAFSPDGKTIALGYTEIEDDSQGVVLWDVAARKRLVDDKRLPQKVIFSPDGKTLAAFGDGVVLWDVATRRRLVDVSLPEDRGHSIAFGPDGKTLAVLSNGVMLYDLELESWQRHAGRMANRNLTRAEWQQFFPEEPYRQTFEIFPEKPSPQTFEVLLILPEKKLRMRRSFYEIVNAFYNDIGLNLNYNPSDPNNWIY